LVLPTPTNLSSWWNFGRLLGVVLSSQLVTGVLLASHYTADVTLAFQSVAHIVRDVNRGWLLRSLHANGASIFFICLYFHIGRGLYHGSYHFSSVWFTGVSLLLIIIASAFLGYVLPWGQISFWGATVITNLVGAIPFVGGEILSWLWGGFSINNSTLTRFFTLHFLCPILAVAVVLAHLTFLHQTGSNNPLGLPCPEKIPFHPYYTWKDIVGFVSFFLLFVSLIFFFPNLLGEPDNFIVANSISTPAHIVPEWYFLFAYAILRSIPNKLGGVLGLLLSFLLLLSLPLVRKADVKSCKFSPMKKMFVFIFFLSFFILSVGGFWPVEEPFLSVTRIYTVTYFSFFLFMAL